MKEKMLVIEYIKKLFESNILDLLLNKAYIDKYIHKVNKCMLQISNKIENIISKKRTLELKVAESNLLENIKPSSICN